MAKTLYAVDELSGFVAACAPGSGPPGSRDEAEVREEEAQAAVVAAAVNREEVQRGIEELGVDLDEHIALVIEALAEQRTSSGSAAGPRRPRKSPRMSRWLKISLGVLAGLVVLLLLNAIVVSNTTKDAERRDDGAQLVDTANGTLQVLEEGNPGGTPIVLVHCYTCSMNWWDDLAPLLAQDHRVIRVDLLGHGGSDKPAAATRSTTRRARSPRRSRTRGSGRDRGRPLLGGTVATALAEQSPELASRS